MLLFTNKTLNFFIENVYAEEDIPLAYGQISRCWNKFMLSFWDKKLEHSSPIF